MSTLREHTNGWSAQASSSLNNLGPRDLKAALVAKEFKIRLHPHYRYVERDTLLSETEFDIPPELADDTSAAFLLPSHNDGGVLIPLESTQQSIFRNLAQGWKWTEAVSVMSETVVERLFCAGVLCSTDWNTLMSGPLLPLLYRGLQGRLLDYNQVTDELSLAALRNASRFPSNDLPSMATRLYLFNGAGVYASEILERAVRDVQEVIDSEASVSSEEYAPPAANAGWHFFRNKAIKAASSSEELGSKLYLSPAVGDTAQCVSRLCRLIPQLRPHGWKVGRGQFGITRPDKICLYFNTRAEAADAGALLAQEMFSIRTQGVPFTVKYDTTGLIGGGFDPPQGIRTIQGASWRDWLARKMAFAILLNRTMEQTFLSDEQSALWTMFFSGINPTTWSVEDDAYWRI